MDGEDSLYLGSLETVRQCDQDRRSQYPAKSRSKVACNPCADFLGPLVRLFFSFRFFAKQWTEIDSINLIAVLRKDAQTKFQAN